LVSFGAGEAGVWVGDGVAAGAEDGEADDAAGVGATVGVWVADAPYPVVAEVAAVILAIHSPIATTAPVSKVMMGDLSFMNGSTRNLSVLVQRGRP
jgi:hypothetical protein